MQMIRWGFMLALLLAIAPMFALPMFDVGEGVGIGPPAASVSIQNAQETLDTGNGIMVRAPDGLITQPTGGAESASGHIGYQTISETKTAALAPIYVRLWQRESGADLEHTVFGISERGAMPLAGGRLLVL